MILKRALGLIFILMVRPQLPLLAALTWKAFQ